MKVSETDKMMFKWFRGTLTSPTGVSHLIAMGYLRITNQNYGHVAATAAGHKAFNRAYEEETIKARLEYLRGELQAERISYGELAELQSLAAHIPESDTELREAAGIPE